MITELLKLPRVEEGVRREERGHGNLGLRQIGLRENYISDRSNKSSLSYQSTTMKSGGHQPGTRKVLSKKVTQGKRAAKHKKGGVIP